MSKVAHHVSKMLPQPHDNEEEVRQRSEIPETPEDDKMSLTRVMFKDIMAKALEQQAANLPVFSINNGVTEGNKTVLPMASFNTGKRYKRETNLKFSEGSMEVYESFRSQFNINHKMLGWDTNRAAIELYMSLEGKAALKVEEVIMNANGTSNIIEMWDTYRSS